MLARKFILSDIQGVIQSIWSRNCYCRSAKCCWSRALFLCLEFIEGGFWRFREKPQMWGILLFNGANRISMKISKLCCIKIFILDSSVFILAFFLFLYIPDITIWTSEKYLGLMQHLIWSSLRYSLMACSC